MLVTLEDLRKEHIMGWKAVDSVVCDSRLSILTNFIIWVSTLTIEDVEIHVIFQTFVSATLSVQGHL